MSQYLRLKQIGFWCVSKGLKVSLMSLFSTKMYTYCRKEWVDLEYIITCSFFPKVRVSNIGEIQHRRFRSNINWCRKVRI